ERRSGLVARRAGRGAGVLLARLARLEAYHLERERVVRRVVFQLDRAAVEGDERRRELLGARPAVFAALRERFLDYVVQRLRDVGAQVGERGRRLVPDLARQLGED